MSKKNGNVQNVKLLMITQILNALIALKLKQITYNNDFILIF